MCTIKDKDAGDREYVIITEDKEGIRVRYEFFHCVNESFLPTSPSYSFSVLHPLYLR